MRDSANPVIREAFQKNTLAKNAFFENVGVAFMDPPDLWDRVQAGKAALLTSTGRFPLMISDGMYKGK
jgi:hypothetical protein